MKKAQGELAQFRSEPEKVGAPVYATPTPPTQTVPYQSEITQPKTNQSVP